MAKTKNSCVELPNGTYRTCEVRLSFPNLFKPGKPMQEGAEGKYGATLLFPAGADLTLLEEAARAAAEAKWGKDYEKITKKPGFRWGVRDQGERDEYDGYEAGAVFINATSQNKPQVFDKYKETLVEESEIYPGVWGLALIRPFAYDKAGNRGIAFGLQGFMKLKDGESIGGQGKIDADKSFGDVELDDDEDASELFNKTKKTRAA